MDDSFLTFKEVIDRAKQSPDFSEAVQIALLARIDYAAGRGDITLNQADILDALLGEGLRDQYADILEVATFGDLDRAAAVA